MKKIVAVILLSCISLWAFAAYFELEAKIPCAKIEELSESFKSYEESPMWIGVVSDSIKAVVTVNIETTTWTIMLVNSTGNACVLTSGKGFSYRPLSKGTSV